MRQKQMMYQWMVSGSRRLQAMVRRGGGVGVLAGLLLLPLGVGALGPGNLDTSFGGDGTVLTDVSSGGHDFAYALAIQPDGKIVVAGDADNDVALARYLPDGTLDTTFGSNGTALSGFGGSRAFAVALQPDGKIVVAGELNSGPGLARYRPDGTLDTTFGSDGTVLTDWGRNLEVVLAVALQPDGKLVVAGYSYDNVSGDPVSGDFALARYRSDGTLDATFGNNGTVLTDLGAYEEARALALQPDGKLVVAGHSSGSFALARYLPNGTLDTTFGSDGTVLTNFRSTFFPGDEAMAIALQPDGKIVVAGVSRIRLSEDEDNVDFALARYRPNGTLDTTFSGDGKILTDFTSFDQANALALQPDGKIVVAGYSFVGGSDNDVALARYRPNGTLDTTFSGDGKILTDFSSGSRSFAFALAVQPRDGRLVVAGWSDASGPLDFALARYHTITCGGVVVTQIGTAGNDTLIGTDGADVIFGFGGNDTIYGLGGNDILCGGTGNDTLDGGSGNDILRGGSGNDTLRAGTGDDRLMGEEGIDVCDGGVHVQKDTAQSCERVTGVP